MNFRNFQTKILIVGSACFTLSSCASIEEAMQNGANPNAAGAATGLLAGLATGVACSQLSGGSEMMSSDPNNPLSKVSKKDARCAAAGAAVGGLTWLASSKVYRGMAEKDKRAALEAASASLETGRPISIELPESGDTFTVATSVEETGNVETASIDTDLASVPKLRSKYVSVGKPLVAPKTVNVRSGPGTQFGTADQILEAELVHVFGKDPATGWVLVGKGVEKKSRWGGKAVKPVAVGYVRSDLLSSNVNDVSEGSTMASFDRSQENVSPVSAQWTISCTTSDLKLSKQDGSVLQDQTKVCYGPLGKESV